MLHPLMLHPLMLHPLMLHPLMLNPQSAESPRGGVRQQHNLHTRRGMPGVHPPPLLPPPSATHLAICSRRAAPARTPRFRGGVVGGRGTRVHVEVQKRHVKRAREGEERREVGDKGVVCLRAARRFSGRKGG